MNAISTEVDIPSHKGRLRTIPIVYQIGGPSEEICERTTGNRARKNSRTNAEDWKAWLRVADSLDPSYRN